MIAANIKAFIDGEWIYDVSTKTLTHYFANNHELIDQGLIDEQGYLLSELKTEIRDALGDEVLENVQGPFGDDDIFSGDIFDEEVHYNIELHHITESNLDALKKNHNVTLKIVD